jgi:hypothetical protein
MSKQGNKPLFTRDELLAIATLHQPNWMDCWRRSENGPKQIAEFHQKVKNGTPLGNFLQEYPVSKFTFVLTAMDLVHKALMAKGRKYSDEDISRGFDEFDAAIREESFLERL